MANTTTHPAVTKSADLGWEAAAHQVAADQAKGDAARYILAGGALAGGVGALRGLYNAYKARKKVNEIQGDINYQLPSIPIGKSAFLKEADGKSFLAGDYAHQYGAMGVPWFLPGLTAALYGGYQLGRKPVEAVATGNIESDLSGDLKKEKNRYLRAVRSPIDPPEPVEAPLLKAASPLLSMERWGPEVGLGTGLLGAASLANFLRGYHKAKDKEKQDKLISQRQSIESSLRPLISEAPTSLPQPISFS